MNTSRIGFIGLPEVATRFEDEGFSVVTGETVIASAQAIRRAISERSDSESPLPVIVEDQHQSGLAGLLTRLQRAAGAIVVVRSGEGILPRDWFDIPLESTLLEYAKAAGLDADESLGLLAVQADGSIIETEPAVEDEPGLDDIDFDEPDSLDGLDSIDFDEPETAPASAPAAEEVDPAPAPTEEEEDPFEDPAPAPAPAPQPSLSDEVFDAAPAAEDSRFDRPSPAPARPVSPTVGPENVDLDSEMPEGAIGRPEVAPAATGRTISRREEAELSPSAREREIAEADAPGRPSDGGSTGRRRRVVTAPPVSPSEDEREIARDTGDFLDEIVQDDDPDYSSDLEDDEDDDEDLFLGRNARRTARARARSSRGRAPVIINGAGKGGVGKTSITIAEGQRAASRGRMDVCVIDMNRGQGDVSGFLKLRRSDLPTIFEAAQIGDITKAFISPSRLEAARGDNVERIEFTLVSAPRAKHAEASRSVVTDRVYRQVIDYARDNFDLVIIDTQIVESTDTSGLIEGVVVPLLTEGAYLVGITDQSRTGTDNLVDHILRRFPEIGERDHGGAITSRNFMTVVNRLSRDVDSAGFERKFGKMSHFAGAIPHDDRVRDLMNAGQVPHDLPSVARVLDSVLYRVTGDDEFHPDATSGRDDEEEGAEKVGLFRRLFGRR